MLCFYYYLFLVLEQDNGSIHFSTMPTYVIQSYSLKPFLTPLLDLRDPAFVLINYFPDAPSLKSVN